MNSDLVISGISGRFPDCDDVDQLKDNLFAGNDLLTEDDRRWPIGLFGLPSRSGKIKHLTRFDAEFFGINAKQVEHMDPQSRILLEVTYEAVVDAGYNPNSLRGHDIGVYVGCALSEFADVIHSDIDSINSCTTMGTLSNMVANRISYTFDWKGPSLHVDTACSSSLQALYHAYTDLQLGKIEKAIVGGTNLNLNPSLSLKFMRSNMLSKDGKCKFLDASADGYVRSESISAILLERRSDSKRIYGTLVNINSNHDGYKLEGIAYPSLTSQIVLMKRTLKEANLDANNVLYVEAHGTGTPAGDQIEAQAIQEVYAQNRSDPILVGSVKTNIGHTEGASGLCSIIKVLLSFQNNSIPASLNYSQPNPKIAALLDKTLVPVIQNTELPEETYIAINSFGFGGSNVHLLLRSEKDTCAQVQSIQLPRLITTSGRTESCVEHVFEFFDRNPEKISNDFLTLFNEIEINQPLSGMECMGYMLYGNDPNLKDFREVQESSPDKREVWFILSGMGTQWKNMCEGLMDLPIFGDSIRQSAEYLKLYGIDLIDILTTDANESFMGSSLGIAAVQIALVDLLKALEIKWDGIVGHSAGEMLCAYVDNLMDTKQVLLSTYLRAKLLMQADLPPSQMAAIGMTWEEAELRCPANVYPACHNSEQSVTISGLYSETNEFLAKLKEEKVFTKEVKSCGLGFHCSLLLPLKESLIKELNPLIPKSKRSEKWLSSSVAVERWSSEECKYSCAEYYVNNLINPVLFLQCTQRIPRNAIAIEIAPDSLFRNILRKTVGQDLTYVGLMRRNNGENNLNHLLSSIGQLYNLGLNPKLQNLYPRSQFPVRRGTQSISPLIKWNHSEEWFVPFYPKYFNYKNIENIKNQSNSVELNKGENENIILADVKNDTSNGIDELDYIQKLNNILGIKSTAKVKRNKKLHELGIDSIMTSELKDLIYGEFNREISLEILPQLTYQQLLDQNKVCDN